MKKLLLISLVITQWSCVTYTRCYEKFGKQLGDSTTHIVEVKDSVVLPADSTSGLVTPSELDSLSDGEMIEVLDLDQEIQPDNTRVQSNRKPKIFITRRGRDFEVKATVPSDTVWMVKKVPCKCPPQVVMNDPKNGWVWLLSGLVIGFVATFFGTYWMTSNHKHD